MDDITLLIMAAGMGSRFGGLKQIEPVGPNGEFIIDYSIYDAYQVGIRKVVFIIKEENYDLFRETVGKRIEQKMEVKYVFQKIDNVPEGVQIPKDRVKPWGTGHAILSAKDAVTDHFIIINADDFYGRDALKKAFEFFNNRKENEYALIGYPVKNTLTEHGAVKRGVCEVKDNYLVTVIESSVEEKDHKIIATPLDGSDSFEVSDHQTVAMNLFCFTKDMMNYLEKDFSNFFQKNKNNLEKCEYLIPDVVCDNVKQDIAKVKVVPTTSVWHGITYKEDLQKFKMDIENLIQSGEYPNQLW